MSSVSAELKPQVAEVRTALEGLQKALSGLTADNVGQKAPAIRAALTQVGAATSRLSSSLAKTCPSG